MGELVLITQIAGRRVAIRSRDIQSVVELEAVVHVPMAPDFVLGLTALRSRALTVIDARAALGVTCDLATPDTRAAVVDVAGHSYALVVDRVCDVVESIEAKEMPATTLGPEWDRVASAMVETPTGPALLIDVAALVEGNERLAA